MLLTAGRRGPRAAHFVDEGVHGTIEPKPPIDAVHRIGAPPALAKHRFALAHQELDRRSRREPKYLADRHRHGDLALG